MSCYAGTSLHPSVNRVADHLPRLNLLVPALGQGLHEHEHTAVRPVRFIEFKGNSVALGFDLGPFQVDGLRLNPFKDDL